MPLRENLGQSKRLFFFESKSGSHTYYINKTLHKFKNYMD